MFIAIFTCYQALTNEIYRLLKCRLLQVYSLSILFKIRANTVYEKQLLYLTTSCSKSFYVTIKVNTEKSQVVKSSQCKFLGFSFFDKQIRWHPKSVETFKRRVRELTDRTRGISMGTKIQKLSVYLRGWINYYGIANQYQRCVDLDHWTRRRIRMCYWKQWGRPRTKIRTLIRLGVPVKAAVACGRSSKSWWRSSKSPGINMALGLEYLREQGPFALRDGWIAFHYGR